MQVKICIDKPENSVLQLMKKFPEFRPWNRFSDAALGWNFQAGCWKDVWKCVVRHIFSAIHEKLGGGVTRLNVPHQARRGQGVPDPG